MASSAHLGGFEEMREDCLRKYILFEDRTFPRYPNRYSQLDWKRPWEISDDPQFIVNGTTRFDLNQGTIGNCWFVAGAATLATRPELLRKVVPTDQGENCAGIFHFNIWHDGEWEEVIIDDRLPTYVDKNGRVQLYFCKNRDQPNEMWGPLLEKAYAKMYGSYESLNGGRPEDALVDLTGGIGKRHNLREPGKNLDAVWELLLNNSKMNSLMGAAVPPNGATTENVLPNGLVTRHAYSITHVCKIKLYGNEYKLVRLRNPWGHQEWMNAWSDRSEEWKHVIYAVRKSLEWVAEDEGEFWMTYGDLVRNFCEIEVCHLPPENRLRDKRKWKQINRFGSWKIGVSAGGNNPSTDQYWTNPQYNFTIMRTDCGGGDRLFIISLMQRKRSASTAVPICFDLYKVIYEGVRLNRHNYHTHVEKCIVYRTNMPQNYREITEELRLQPGNYVVIPSTLPNTQRDFLLRFCIEENVDKE